MDGKLNYSLDTSNRGSGSVSFQSNKATPTAGMEIGIYWLGTRVFGGTIERVNTVRASPVSLTRAMYTCTFASWEKLLQKRRIQSAVYVGMDAGDIIHDIIANYAPDEGLTAVDVQTGALAADLGTLKYEATSIAEAFDDLANKSGYIWWVDPEKGYYFRNKSTTTASPLALTNAAINIVSHESSETMEDYANAGQIRVSWDGIPPETSGVLHGDGTVRTFDIPDVMSVPQLVDHISKITLGGVEATVGILNIDTDKQFYYQPGSKTITQDPAEPVLTSADDLEIFYWILGRNIITWEETGEITARATIEGTGSTGRYEIFLDDSSNVDQVGALNKLKAEIKRRCPGLNGGTAGAMPKVHDIQVWSYKPDAVASLLPGHVISIDDANPSTGGAIELLIQTVNVQEVVARNAPGASGRGVLLYSVVAVDYVRVDDFVDFFKSIAGGGSSGGGGGTSVGSGSSGGGSSRPAQYTVPVVSSVATPNPSLGYIQKITVTGLLTIAAPAGTPSDGDLCELLIIQDATTGGFQYALNAIYKLGDFTNVTIDKGTYALIPIRYDGGNWYLNGPGISGQSL